MLIPRLRSGIAACCVLAALQFTSATAGYQALDGSPPQPGVNAKDFLRVQTVSGKPPPEIAGNSEVSAAPHDDATPGDTSEYYWTECDDSGKQCTRYFRSDRWQRVDALAEEDPATGRGEFRWVPWKWVSRSCAASVCSGMKIDSDPG